MNLPYEQAESRMACLIFAIVLLAFVAVMIFAIVHASKDRRHRDIVSATLTGHSMIIPTMQCPRCLRLGHKGKLEVHHAVCMNKECQQHYRVTWNGKFGTLVPKQEADLDFDEWALSEEQILEELKKRI